MKLSDTLSNTAVLTITPKSATGKSIFTHLEHLSLETFNEYLPPDGSIEKIEQRFRAIGARIESSSRVGVTVSMTRALFERYWRQSFEVKRNKYIRNLSRWRYHSDSQPLSLPFLADLIEDIRFPCGSFELANSQPPSLNRHHLKVPDDIARVGGLIDFHRQQATGKGIKVAMIDSGLWPHPYFEAHGYNIDRQAAISLLDPMRDERGHGTAMSSVLLSVAPQIELMMMKMSCRELSFPVAAFQQAVSCDPHIINCSWGTIGHEPQLHLEVMNAIDLGIQVVFAAGNGSTDRKTAMFQSIAVPESVTVGGVFIDEQFSPSSLSDISSSFISEVYTGRSVPDVCGPCGMLPDAQLILFPTEPGSDFDKRNGETDGTGKEDGWLVSSGTSAAAAWVSGHTAILMQLSPQDSNKNYKEVLRRYCQPVRRGVSAMGLEVNSNVQGSDLASGAGFVRFAKELMNDFNGNTAL